MAIKKKKPIVKKERTLLEFRAWLEGVEELQGDDWHPDINQWQLIRAAIDGIVETEYETYVPPPMYQQATLQTNRQQINHGPTTEDSSQTRGPLVFPSSEMTPAARAVLSGVAPTLPPSMVPDAGGKLRTPNIDTSDGEFNSGFA